MSFQNLKDNRVVKFFYKTLFYFELGKGTTYRVYQIIPDLIIVLGGIKYLLGIDLTIQFIIAFTLTILIFFTLFGIFISKTGLYAIDRYTQVSKDPVQTEILNAARKINAKK